MNSDISIKRNEHELNNEIISLRFSERSLREPLKKKGKIPEQTRNIVFILCRILLSLPVNLCARVYICVCVKSEKKHA